MDMVMERKAPRCPECGKRMEMQWLGKDRVWVCPDCGLPQK